MTVNLRLNDTSAHEVSRWKGSRSNPTHDATLSRLNAALGDLIFITLSSSFQPCSNGRLNLGRVH